jgi:hypothetical protein
LWNCSIPTTQHPHDKHIIDVVIDAFVGEQEIESRLWANNLQKNVIVNEKKDGTNTHDVCLDALPRVMLQHKEDIHSRSKNNLY